MPIYFLDKTFITYFEKLNLETVRKNTENSLTKPK